MIQFEDNLQVDDNDEINFERRLAELQRAENERIAAATEAHLNKVLLEQKKRAMACLKDIGKVPSLGILRDSLHFARKGVIDHKEVRKALAISLRAASENLLFTASFAPPGSEPEIYKKWSSAYSKYADSLDKGEEVRIEFLTGGEVVVPAN